MSPEPAPTSSARAMPALPVRWDTLTAEATHRELAQLGPWVAKLIDRYQLDGRTIPACWREHGALIEELSALRTAWLSSYALTAAGNAPLAWHASFATCRTRLSEYTARTGCTSSQHRGQEQGLDRTLPWSATGNAPSLAEAAEEPR